MIIKQEILVVGTTGGMIFLVSTFDYSIQAQVAVLGGSGQCSVVSSINRGYVADQANTIDVLDLNQNYLLQNFTQTPYLPAQGLTAINYDSSTEIWTFNEKNNVILVYEWNRH